METALAVLTMLSLVVGMAAAVYHPPPRVQTPLAAPLEPDAVSPHAIQAP